jgi:hypothetical protein
VAPKNPIGRLADSAISSIKDPLGTAGKVVEQAKGTAALGKMVAEQVGKSAISKATGTAGAVVGRASGRKPSADKGDIADVTTEGASLRSVPDVNEPAHTTKPSAERAAESTKQHGDPMRKPAARTAAKKAPAQKTAAKKAPAKRPAAKTPVPSPKDVAEVVEAAVAEDPTKTAAQPVKKSTAKRTAPGDKLPTKKGPSTQQPGVKKVAGKTVAGKKVAGKKAAPKTAEQVATAQGDAVTTPVGTPGAGKGRNPDTAERDLNQPGTEGIVDEATVKAVASEAKTMRKAAERNPE